MHPGPRESLGLKYRTKRLFGLGKACVICRRASRGRLRGGDGRMIRGNGIQIDAIRTVRLQVWVDWTQMAYVGAGYSNASYVRTAEQVGTKSTVRSERLIARCRCRSTSGRR